MSERSKLYLRSESNTIVSRTCVCKSATRLVLGPLMRGKSAMWDDSHIDVWTLAPLDGAQRAVNAQRQPEAAMHT